jgi:hypothetical protein
MDFNPNTGTTPDRASWEGGLNALAAMRDAANKHRPQFLLLADDSFDRLGACVDACGGAKSPIESAYPPWRTLIRITDPAKTDVLDGAVLSRATVILAPASPAALNEPAWKSVIERIKK